MEEGKVGEREGKLWGGNSRENMANGVEVELKGGDLFERER